jgi:hypothetical protein
MRLNLPCFYLCSLAAGILLMSTTNISTSAPNTGSSSTPMGNPPLSTPSSPKKEEPAQKYVPYVPPKPEVHKIDASTVFSEPGVGYYSAGQWVGSDYLGNIPKNFRLLVEIVSSISSMKLPSDDLLTNAISQKLTKATFSPSKSFNSTEVLPFLHLLILVQPIEDRGYAISSTLSFFESVKIDRVLLQSEGEFQAITWEKEVLQVLAIDDASEQLMKTVMGQVDQFISRYQAFDIKSREEQK